MLDPTAKSKIAALMPPLGKEVLGERGIDLVQRIGIEVVRQVIFDVLCGRNLRDSTEMLTRRRIAMLNAATLVMFLRTMHSIKDFTTDVPDIVAAQLKNARSKHERWILQWMLGLTDKAAQNVLRDEFDALDAYKAKYVEVCKEIITACEANFGVLKGDLELNPQEKATLNWAFIVYFANTIGAETLAIRGSEKSIYGKLFERLILGSVLSILGFRLVPPPPNLTDTKRVFWLSQRTEKRESDATVLIAKGRGVRFDIGFIGRGNPEITLDKITRFEQELQLGRQRWYLATFIIVDRIGERGRIRQLAERVGGTVIQMSMGYWPKLLAQELKSKVGYTHELVQMQESQIENYLREKLAGVPIEKFV